ncbi:LPS export ABC transporter permease LptG [Rubrivivax gelatinosus]|uniref:LPS export ABC transporter permease LptG n=2 Tax=Rubrivivax gelatinosus TaxID=28068 RepID=UPI001903E6D9|nr:LPS export ABC transporter permease LptG [Rubrivivax gelatinosus]MBK1615214.1 LPS export ABC transporter permease LptG [Rubrivivax gelatinosus]
MRTVRRLLYRDIVASVFFVALAFLSLFFFIDLVEKLDNVGRAGRTTGVAVLAALLELPSHFYELMPIAVLIGTIYSLARLAQSSEFTILRTGGLGPGRALSLLAVLGVVFAAITFVVGDYVVPAAERQAVAVKTLAAGGLRVGGRTGAWLKEKRMTPQGERNYSINLAGTTRHGALRGIRIFQFDADGRLSERISASTGSVAADGTWTLADAELTRWPDARGSNIDAGIVEQRVPELRWPSTLTPEVVAAAVLPQETMTTAELWRYSVHLSDQAQAAQSYEILFWKKALYPLACLVMMALALPFAYLHARAGSVSLKVFGGIMLGIGFVLLNNLAGHVGLLRNWTPWIAASTPSLLFLMLSLGAFAWLVRYR